MPWVLLRCGAGAARRLLRHRRRRHRSRVRLRRAAVHRRARYGALAAADAHAVALVPEGPARERILRW